MNVKIDEHEFKYICQGEYKTNGQIAKILNVSISAVVRARKRFGLQQNRTKIDVEEVKRLAGTTTYRELAKKFNCNQQSISYIARKNGIIKNYKHKVDYKKFIEIFPTTSNKDISNKFHCSIVYVSTLAKKLGIKKIRKERPNSKPIKVVVSKAKKEPKRTRKIDYKEFVEIYPTMKNIEIANKFHCSRVRVSQVAKLLGLKAKRRGETTKEEKPIKVKIPKPVKPKKIVATTTIVRQKAKKETQNKRIITDPHLLELIERAKMVEARQFLTLN